MNSCYPSGLEYVKLNVDWGCYCTGDVCKHFVKVYEDKDQIIGECFTAENPLSSGGRNGRVYCVMFQLRYDRCPVQELCGVERDSGWVADHFRIVADCTAWLTGAGIYIQV